jgi:hypothetical protein
MVIAAPAYCCFPTLPLPLLLSLLLLIKHRCVEYFKVSTNHGRFLEIGNKESTAPLKTNKPATGAFLGFFKGFTDVVNSNAATGKGILTCVRQGFG